MSPELVRANKRLLEIEEEWMTEEQRETMQVDLQDTTSKLGELRTKAVANAWRSKYMPHKGKKQLEKAARKNPSP